MGLTKDKDEPDKIVGDSDGTLIGNIEDRLKVNIQGGQLPDETITIAAANFENAGSSDMAVDGSSTSVLFTAGPSTTDETWYVTRLSISMSDNGNAAFNDFGAIASGLTNGVLVEQIINSVAYPITLIKNNDELIAGFESRLRGQGNSFINDSGYINGNTMLTVPLTLNESTSDIMRITIQDDLSGLDLFVARMFYRRVI